MRATLGRLRRMDRWLKAVTIAILVYSIVYSTVSILKYLSFSTFAWDLGIYNQVMWSLLHRHDFHYTAEYFINPSGDYLAQHFSPDLILLLPFYALVPSPATLLVIQSVVVALGAYAVWLLCKDRGLPSRTAGFLSIAYLVYPPVLGANWYDFHLETLFMTSMLFAVHFWQRQRWIAFWATLLIAIFTLESAAIFAAFFGITLGLVHKPEVEGFLRRPSRANVRGWMPLLVVSASLAIFFFVRTYQRSLNPTIPPEFLAAYRASDNWSILGISNPLDPLELFTTFLLRPDNVLRALAYALPGKILYASFYVVPLLGLPLRRPWWLIPAVPWLTGLFLSNYTPYYTLGYHYSSFLVPWFFVAAIRAFPSTTAERPVRASALEAPSTHPGRVFERPVVVGVVYLVATSLLLAGVPGLAGAVGVPPGFAPGVRAGLLVPSPEVWAIWSLLGLIPPTSSIVTQNDLFSPLSSRENAYVIPYLEPIDVGWSYAARYVSDPIEFVLLDRTSDPPAADFMCMAFVDNGTYGLYAVAGTVHLYRRDYSGAPQSILETPSSSSGGCPLSDQRLASMPLLRPLNSPEGPGMPRDAPSGETVGQLVLRGGTL